jgi:hypothetical protein
MGGNFALAAPDPNYTFPALGNCDLTIQVSTKLNRIHLKHIVIEVTPAKNVPGQRQSGDQ